MRIMISPITGWSSYSVYTSTNCFNESSDVNIAMGQASIGTVMWYSRSDDSWHAHGHREVTFCSHWTCIFLSTIYRPNVYSRYCYSLITNPRGNGISFVIAGFRYTGVVDIFESMKLCSLLRNSMFDTLDTWSNTWPRRPGMLGFSSWKRN